MIPPLSRGDAPRPGLFADILAGDVLGIEITDFLTPTMRAEVNRRLDADRGTPRTPLPGFERHPRPPFLYGRSLVAASPDRRAYHEAAAVANPALDALCPGWRLRLEQTLEVLTGLPAQAPQTADGRPYAAATVRELPAGQGIGLHVGNAFLHAPQAAELARSVEVELQLSWFILLRAPAGGGELVVYDLRWEHVAGWYARDDVDLSRPPPAAALVGLADKQALELQEGSLLVFDGGRFFHQVLPVKGEPPRRTLGGFAARARSGASLAYWS
ncbi:MAG: 2OG-Fe(II) oxygenase [Alphaproteobacteria bacterium]|nr:2OG-Fe(II) oxygenase [Alphaproteobacteria bacterium]